jgi:hypothetical protein
MHSLHPFWSPLHPYPVSIANSYAEFPILVICSISPSSHVLHFARRRGVSGGCSPDGSSARAGSWFGHGGVTAPVVTIRITVGGTTSASRSTSSSSASQLDASEHFFSLAAVLQTKPPRLFIVAICPTPSKGP